MRTLRSLPLVPVFLVSACHIAGAGVVFSNLGPGDSYSSFSGWTVNSTFQTASAFTAAANAILGEVDIALMGNVAADNGTMRIKLAANASGVPGAVIEDLGAHTPLVIQGSTDHGSLVTALSLAHPALVAGTQYWIMISPDNPAAQAAWELNSVGNLNPTKQFDGGAWVDRTPAPAFRVTEVPEPASCALVGLALPLLWRFASRRRSRPLFPTLNL